MLRRWGVGRVVAAVVFYWLMVLVVRGWVLIRAVEARALAYKAAHPGSGDVLFELEPWPNRGSAAVILLVPPLMLLFAWYRARLQSRPAV